MLVVTCEHCRSELCVARGFPHDGVPLAEAIQHHLLDYDVAGITDVLVLVGRSGHEALREMGMQDDEYHYMPVKLDWSLNEHVQLLPAAHAERGRCPDGELPICSDTPTEY